MTISKLGALLPAAVLCVFFASGLAGAETPVRLAITDLEGLEQIQREFGGFRDRLSRDTGIPMEFYPVPNRTAAVEAMNAKKVDLVLTGPAEYVVFRKRTGAVPVLGFSRPDYFATIAVLADSGLGRVADLRGKKVALGPVGSTSKHLAPVQILKDNGLTPGADVEIVHTSIELGWEALKRGDVAAFGTTNDKFLKLREQEKTMAPGSFRVIARGPDLPNDVLLARADLDASLVETIRTAILKHSEALVAEILKGEDNQKFRGMKFLATVKDSDYDYIRAMYATAGFPQFAAFIGE
ncbi:MAG: phosphate/phosphite/phosphonate ABC transporter substrate-binding protein [Gammaproteobacteria bacterium]